MAIDSYDTQNHLGTLLHVTEAFGWFRSDFPRDIDLYDTQTCTGMKPPVDLIWTQFYSVENYDSRTYKSPWERERNEERDRQRELEREKDGEIKCLIP